jgi:hypothetical protein
MSDRDEDMEFFRALADDKTPYVPHVRTKEEQHYLESVGCDCEVCQYYDHKLFYGNATYINQCANEEAADELTQTPAQAD